jgi:hypothetical protein
MRMGYRNGTSGFEEVGKMKEEDKLVLCSGVCRRRVSTSHLDDVFSARPPCVSLTASALFLALHSLVLILLLANNTPADSKDSSLRHRPPPPLGQCNPPTPTQKQTNKLCSTLLWPKKKKNRVSKVSLSARMARTPATRMHPGWRPGKDLPSFEFIYLVKEKKKPKPARLSSRPPLFITGAACALFDRTSTY